jgi:hypothetical protein
MDSKRFLMLLVIVAFAVLNSCSGLENKCTTNCGGSGKASLSITISDTTPSGASVVSFSLPIIGITLTPSSGSAISVFSSNPSTDFELTRLQTDTNLIANNVSVDPGTYTAVNVTVAAPSGVFVNSSSSSMGSCVASGVCALSGSAATITYTFSSPLTLTANTNQFLDLDFNYNNALVVGTSGALSIDVTQSGVMTASTSIPTGVPTGDFANIDDFTGAVSAISSTSITLKSTARGTLTASITSSTAVYDPQSQCSGSPTVSCIQVGSIVSLQAVLTTSGVVTGTSLDIIDVSTKPADEVEGLIYPSSCNGTGSYGLVLSDSSISTSASPLATAAFGAGVCLTLQSTAGFYIDTGILTGQSGIPTSVGFSNSNDILSGQVVRAKVTGAASGTSGINATATALILRFSRFTATLGTVSGNTFGLSSLPGYFPSFVGTPQVDTYTNATILEGVSNVSSLSTGNVISISALFLNPNDGITYPFQAAKIRLQSTN